jgi:hypothetical protein
VPPPEWESIQMPRKNYEIEDLKVEAKKLSGNRQSIVFADDQGYNLITPEYFSMIFLGKTAYAAMRKIRGLYQGGARKPLRVSEQKVYTEAMFTNIRMYLMLARNEILSANSPEKDEAAEGAGDVLNIFSWLCALDNQVIAAQKVRAFTDTKVLAEFRDLALKRRMKK